MDAKILLALTIVGVVFAAGCIGQVSPTGGVTDPEPELEAPQVQPEPETNGNRGLYQPPAGNPFVSIVSPADGATLEGTTAVGVRLEVESFRLSGATKELRENEGRIHAILEGSSVKEQYTPSTVFSFIGVEPGAYTLKVELVDNQKNPIGVSDSVDITLA